MDVLQLWNVKHLRGKGCLEEVPRVLTSGPRIQKCVHRKADYASNLRSFSIIKMAAPIKHKAYLNVDLGEAYGNYVCGPDLELLPMIDHANVACGFHAG